VLVLVVDEALVPNNTIVSSELVNTCQGTLSEHMRTLFPENPICARKIKTPPHGYSSRAVVAIGTKDITFPRRYELS